MHITLRTLRDGSHSVWMKGERYSFSPDGGTQTGGYLVATMDEKAAVAGVIAAHKALCWSRGKCQGHDVTVG